MARRLKTYVHVDGVPYGPDDDVPADVAKRIGDHAWEGGSAGTAPAPAPDSGVDEQPAARDSSSSTSKRTAAKRTAPKREG